MTPRRLLELCNDGDLLRMSPDMERFTPDLSEISQSDEPMALQLAYLSALGTMKLSGVSGLLFRKWVDVLIVAGHVVLKDRKSEIYCVDPTISQTFDFVQFIRSSDERLGLVQLWPDDFTDGTGNAETRFIFGQ